MKIQKNILLAPYTTFKIGGAAKFFCEVKNEEEILEALKFAREKNLSVFVLGGGSNLLVSDKGFDGLVIKIQNSKFKIQNLLVECGAGIALSKAVNELTKFGLTGLEWAAGIPGGTIGGAVRGNAGAFGSSMGEIVESVKALEISKNSCHSEPRLLSRGEESRANSRSFSTGSFASAYQPLLRMTAEDCQFSYRNSIFKHNPNLIILSATLKLKKGNKVESEKKIKEILAMRKEKQPMEFPSPGSFFKNPITKDKKLIRQFEIDTGKKLKDNKIPAGYLIDQLDLRGKRIGGAMVSEKHANFIVNTSNANAENVIMLTAIIKTKVRNKFGIQLQEEVQMVGF